MCAATVTIASATKLHGDLRILTSLGPQQKISNGFWCHVPSSVGFFKRTASQELILESTTTILGNWLGQPARRRDLLAENYGDPPSKKRSKALSSFISSKNNTIVHYLGTRTSTGGRDCAEPGSKRRQVVTPHREASCFAKIFFPSSWAQDVINSGSVCSAQGGKISSLHRHFRCGKGSPWD